MNNFKFDGWVAYWVFLIFLNFLGFIVSGIIWDIGGLITTIIMLFFCISALYKHLESVNEG